jgi:uncharacterized membrane protein
MELARTTSLIAAVITAGLNAGLFATFWFAVMPGLARTDDRTFVAAMQGINVAILNVWFGICFAGAGVFALVAVVLHLRGGMVVVWVAAGVVFHLATVVITMRFNVPLNDQLAAGSLADAALVRERFEDAWVRLNLYRVVTSLGAFGCLVGALVIR